MLNEAGILTPQVEAKIVSIQKQLFSLRQNADELTKKTKAQETAYDDAQSAWAQTMTDMEEPLDLLREKAASLSDRPCVQAALQLLQDDGARLLDEQDQEARDILAACRKEYDANCEQLAELNTQIGGLEASLRLLQSGGISG